MTEIQRKKGPNSTLIKKEKYDRILKRLLDLQQNRGLEKNKVDYYYLKKYEIQETTIENTTTRKLLKKGYTKRYIFEEEMFDVINNIHNAKVMLDGILWRNKSIKVMLTCHGSTSCYISGFVKLAI